jgi:type IV pilus assembly protein PilY1
MQLNVLTGGDTGVTQFDLNNDREFTSDDQVTARDPVGRHMGGGVRSQLIAVSADGVDVFQSNYDKNSAPVVEPTVSETTTTVTGDRGVSGGHFDFDVYCYTNCGDGLGSSKSKGYYYLGQNSEINTRDLYFTHVHEYDDIYDVTGVNMLAPSQSLFKAARVKYGAGTTSTTTTHVPDTPTLEANEQVPGSNVTTVSTTTDTTARSARRLPSKTFNYSDSAWTTVAGFPTSTANSTTITKTSKSTYRTTLTTVEPVTTGPKNSNNRWPYNLKTVVRYWDTVVTTVTTTPLLKFKVLMANQAYSPAVTFSLADAGFTFSAKAHTFQSTTGLTSASLHTFSLSPVAGGVTALQVNMPLDAFKTKDWGTGIDRAGLHPTKADCVYNNPRLGPLNEWRNGALTIQLIDPSTGDSDIQLNVSTKPELGYRLKASSMKAKLIAEYTLFWHHPNNLCMADSGWTMKPPQDNSVSDALQGVKAENGDPLGLFGGDANGGGGTVMTPGTTTTTVTNANGSQTTTTVVIVANVSGGYTITTTVTTVPASALSTNTGIVTGGAVGTNGRIDTGGIDKNAADLGRITWRELQK